MGERGQNQRTPFGENEDAAVKEFKKILKQKTGYAWEDVVNSGERIEKKTNKYRIIVLGDKD